MVGWFKRAGAGAPEAAAAPAHAALAAAVVQAERVARLEHWVEQLRNELDTKASALLRASMRHEALREELESANAKLGELKEQVATAAARAFEHKLQHAESTVQSTALGSARTRAEAVARVHAHLRLLGLAQALSARGSEESAELELQLVPAHGFDEAFGHWLAAYAIECVNVCLSECFRLDQVEGSSAGLDIRAARGVVAPSVVAARAAASNSIVAARARVAENCFDDEGAALRTA